MFKKLLPYLVIVFVLAVNLYLGLPRLTEYSAVDEPYWTYGRTSKFWNAVKNAEWRKTDVNDKPGITVAIISGLGLAKYDPMAYKTLREKPKTDEQLQDIIGINFWFRLPIFLFTLAMLPLFYFLLKKLFGQMLALLAFVLIGFSPIIFGISLIINPDSLLWIFMPLSLLSYFVFLQDQRRNYLYLSGVFLGFSLLTKYVSNILIIFYLLTPFVEYIFAEQKPNVRSYFKQALLNYLVLIFFATLTYFMLYPATWVDLEKLLEGTFLSKAFKTTWPIFITFFLALGFDWIVLKSKITAWILDKLILVRRLVPQVLAVIFLGAILFVLADTYSGMRPFDFPAILASPKNSETNPLLALKSVGNLAADIYSLIFGIAPLALVGLLVANLSFFKRFKTRLDRADLTIFYFIFLIGFYYMASTVNHVVATVRYQIVLYPLALIVAALGLVRLLQHFRLNQPKYRASLLLLTIITSLWGLLSVKPNYFAYSSSLLPQKYFVNYKDMGDGSFEAAQYLNNLPNAKELSIWSDKGAVCAVFVGECEISFLPKKIKGKRFDYFIVSSGRKSKDLKLAESRSTGSLVDFKKAHETDKYAFKVEIANRANNYVKVVPAELVYKK